MTGLGQERETEEAKRVRTSHPQRAWACDNCDSRLHNPFKSTKTFFLYFKVL